MVIVLSCLSIYPFGPNTYLQTFGHCIVCLSFRLMASDYPFGIIEPLVIILYVLSMSDLRLSVWYHRTFCHYIVCPFNVWLSIIRLVSSNLLSLLICFFFDLWLLIIRMVSPNDLSLYCTSFRFLASDFPFGICKRFVIALSVLSMFWLMIIKLFIYFTLCPTAN